MVARAEFTDLFVDYYLHLATHGLRHEPVHDQKLKDAMAALTLHCASRPWNETVAWTIHFQDPLLNLFVGGDNKLGTIIGNLFTQDVKKTSENMFYSEVVSGNEPLRRSVVTFEADDSFGAVEQFYRQSEQRLARYFDLGDEEYVFITAQPECDLAWLESLTTEQVRRLNETEKLRLLEERKYRWECGCNQERIMNFLGPAMRSDPEELFGGEEALRIHCPRCGARHMVTREAMEAYVVKANQKKAKP